MTEEDLNGQAVNGINDPVDTEDVLLRADKKQRNIRDGLARLDNQFGKRLAGVYEGIVLAFDKKLWRPLSPSAAWPKGVCNTTC